MISMDKDGKRLVVAVAGSLAHARAQQWARRQGMVAWQAALIGALAAAAAGALLQRAL
ncbi:hypothetical protein [Streptomyces sp. NRRL B-24484]|uniref:hypothetical protein n=1 Tax=Streptomyces sp. NRRL B-24484 TaxID=1463833 RepID=UPI00133158FE|nr:hypothetical protein [Streptomyces sp. NRRL B-24484]